MERSDRLTLTNDAFTLMRVPAMGEEWRVSPKLIHSSLVAHFVFERYYKTPRLDAYESPVNQESKRGIFFRLSQRVLTPTLRRRKAG